MRPPETGLLDVPTLERLLQRRLGSVPLGVCPESELVARVQDGGADPDEVAAAGEHLRRCERCARAVRLLQRLDREQAAPARWRLAPLLAWGGAGLVALLLVAAGWLLLAGDGATLGEGRFLVKGAVDSMSVAVKRGDRAFVAGPGDRLLDGDRLGFFYSSQRPGYLAFFDLDQAGETGLLFPAGGSESGSVAAGEDVRLPDGGLWRAGRGCAWLVGIFSERPLPVEELREQLRRSSVSGTECGLRLEHPEARTLWVQRVR